MIRFQRLRALILKETTQLVRDPRTLVLILSLPVILLFLFAYAVSLTVYHLPTALVDQSHDPESRKLVDAFHNSGYFDFVTAYDNELQIRNALDAGIVKAGLLIPPGIKDDVQRGKANILVLLDGSDSFSVQSGFNAASLITQKLGFDLVAEKITGPSKSLPLPIITNPRVLYNPDLNDLVFLVPGLVALLVQNIIVSHAAMAVVREREAGTMEQLLITPSRPVEILIAKLVPGSLLAIIEMVIILLLSTFWFKVPFQGSLPLFAALAVLFIISGMALGLLISTVSKTQRMAQQISVVMMVFGVLLTGFIFPRTSMPLWTQVIGNLIPLTYFVRIARGIITKGIGMEFMLPDTLSLVAFALVCLVLSSILFKRRLE
ncbi:MAG TPA: ABC transporter permease [Anaerolineaceae bacterium]|nr:ABC transporter permease [Anaerolineaceae bacterium]